MRYDRAIVLKGGKVGVGRRPLPWSVPGDRGFLAPGNVAQGTFEMFPRLIEIQQRVAPWSRLYFAPEIWSSGSDSYASVYSTEVRGNYHRCNGLAFNHNGEDYAISTLQQPHLISRTVYHELFHNISSYLSPEAHDLLNKAVERGAWFPDEYGGRLEERKARLFECFANALDEGLSVKYDFGSATEILAKIYTGEVAREILAQKG